MRTGPVPTAQDPREHLTVPPTWWLFALAFGLTLVVVVGAYTNFWFGAATAVLSLLGIGAGFYHFGHPVVAVDQTGLRAGHAHIDWEWVAGAEALDEKQMREALGPGSLASGWFLTRPYIKGGVRVELADPADPHPFWLVSSRRPQVVAHLVNERAAGRP
ncbi:DUF3093 domain-containing protein [Luteococcus sp. Sow4_B9]|uniref:DUF3093 domain-containing protein n=1 Tax=Luteococcus sp. Sow4_B9 TaxID=3438792 RepID=UPI003F95D6CB